MTFILQYCSAIIKVSAKWKLWHSPMHWAGYQAFSVPNFNPFKILYHYSDFVSCKSEMKRKNLFMIFFPFQTKLGDYQAGYTDDQCFCYDEVESWFFLAISQSSFLWIVRAGKSLVTSTQWSSPSIWPALCSNATGRARQIFQGDAERCKKILQKY